MARRPDARDLPVVTVCDEIGITSITSIESRHDAKGALYAQAHARAGGDVKRNVTRFRSLRVIDGQLVHPPVRSNRRRVGLYVGGGVAWLGLLPLGMYTAGQLGALTAALIGLAAAAVFLALVFPLRLLAVLATAVMYPLHLLTGHTCSGAHCPGCAG